MECAQYVGMWGYDAMNDVDAMNAMNAMNGVTCFGYTGESNFDGWRRRR